MKKLKGLDCVLLVDDEESNHFFNKLLIKKLDVDVHVQVTMDGQEALEYLTCTGKYSEEPNFPQPGLILLDINMPRMNGWEFLKKYEHLPPEQKGKIVMSMLTSSSNHRDISKVGEIQTVKDYIIKPLTLEKLEEVINANFGD